VKIPTVMVAVQSDASVYLTLRIPKVSRAVAEEWVAVAERSGLAFPRGLWRGRLGWLLLKKVIRGQGWR